MPDEAPSTLATRALAAQIITAYLRNNKLAVDQIGGLIAIVSQALASLEKPALREEETPRTPAVTIRQSIQPAHVVCLDCGWRGSMLRRHLSAAHGLTVDGYRARWNLPADHAVTAPLYSARRATIAKQAGLGRRA